MAGGTPFEDPDHSRPSDPGFHKDTGTPQLSGDECRSFLFMKGEFRVGVNFSSGSDEVVFQLCRLIQKTNRGCEPDA